MGLATELHYCTGYIYDFYLLQRNCKNSPCPAVEKLRCMIMTDRHENANNGRSPGNEGQSYYKAYQKRTKALAISLVKWQFQHVACCFVI